MNGGWGSVEMRRADWVFPAQPQSVSQARVLIAQEMGDLPDELMGDLLLLASEVMTNAVRHGLGPVGLTVGWDEAGVRVEVKDQSPGQPAVQAIDHKALNGRGLLLVDGLASDWGVQVKAPGKIVWFTLHTYPPPVGHSN